jgi:hypothetical protein
MLGHRTLECFGGKCAGLYGRGDWEGWESLDIKYHYMIVLLQKLTSSSFSLTPSGETMKSFGIGTLCSRIRCHQGPHTLLAFFLSEPYPSEIIS